MLVVPFAHDQPDNARRVERLGIARSILRERYTAKAATRELRCLLDEPSYAQRATAIGQQIRRENGVEVACGALEALLRTD
jgi:UDP:flavonoid glycosyltransferase YjiC (YdhE family)